MSATLTCASLIVCASAVVNASYAPPEGGYVLRHEAVVPAPTAEVWQALSTAEGWMGWAVPFARMELRVGGLIETSYQQDARAGDPANILNRILAFLPGRMLVIQAERAPPGFAHATELRQLFSVLEVMPHGDDASLVAISGVGYTDSPAHHELRAHFERGNAWTLERLVERFTTGPMDWAALFGAQAPATPGEAADLQ